MFPRLTPFSWEQYTGKSIEIERFIKPKTAQKPLYSNCPPPFVMNRGGLFLFQAVVRPVLVSREVKPLGLRHSRVIVFVDWDVG